MTNTSSQLSQRQRSILGYVADFRSDHNYSPSIRQIVDGCGVPSTASVHYHLTRLDAKGLLDFNVGIARGAIPTYAGLAMVESIHAEAVEGD